MKALADPSRLRIVVALHGRELCLCQIVELVGLATSTVSRHMSILERARLIDARKDGRWTYFRLAGETGRPEASEAAALVLQSPGPKTPKSAPRQGTLEADSEDEPRRTLSPAK